jgi:pyruvate,orthophosphate dikinase
VREHTGAPFPQDPEQQLWGAVGAVFRSWHNERAQRYRRLHGISESLGTAVNVQAMVFGNMGDDCATGVAFTRDPNDGQPRVLRRVPRQRAGRGRGGGIRTPRPINAARARARHRALPTLEEEMPRAYRELVRIATRLERHYRDMQDIEFTIQRGRLWLLQTRTGKRTARAAVRIAVDLVHERRIRREEAIARVDPHTLDDLLHPTLDPACEREPVARGLPASPGAAVGRGRAVGRRGGGARARGRKVILVRTRPRPTTSTACTRPRASSPRAAA